MLRKTLRTLALLTVSQSLIGSAVAAEPAFYFAPRTVVLSGKIVIDRYFEPKSDSKIAVPVLILRKPISVRAVGDPEPSQGSWRFGITRIQIVPLIDYEALCGHSVQVEGMLAEGNENFETKITLLINRIISQQVVGACVTNDRTVSHGKSN